VGCWTREEAGCRCCRAGISADGIVWEKDELARGMSGACPYEGVEEQGESLRGVDEACVLGKGASVAGEGDMVWTAKTSAGNVPGR